MTQTALITGASGLLGRQVQRQFLLDGWKSIGTGLSRISPPDVIRLDILDPQEIERVLDEVKPNVLVHCAANRFPDSCTADPEAARKINVESSRALAEAAVARDIFLIYISTDYVFSGRPGEAPYKSSSKPSPPNVYGQTKLEGEQAVLDVASSKSAKNKVVVLRVPVLYGSCHEPHESAVNVLMAQLWNAQQIADGQPKVQVDDYALRFPTNTQDVGRVCRDISKLYLDMANVDCDLPKILQFSSEDKMTKWEICQTFADIMGLPLDNMVPFKPAGEPKDGTVRPYDCHLDTSALRDLGIDVRTVDFRTWWRREVGAFPMDATVGRKSWKPLALRAPVLILTVFICWALIAILQFLLNRSQRDSGIIFASKISDLPLGHTFLYLYFPTIVAVIFSIYWAWIDLETKRMEPYYQLSKENGALGKDSLLLHYPFDFLPLVPLKACRDRHWPVFWASFAVVLVAWGLVPTQAGIFSVRIVTRTANATFSVSTSSIPVADQAAKLGFRYAQSTYGIVTLNETLPAFMARNYTLKPFQISSDVDEVAQGQENWTAKTTMYFLNLYCEDASHKATNSKRRNDYTSNNGCNFTAGLTGNQSVGEDFGLGSDTFGVKQYTGQYVGYWNHQGFADYSLDAYCPDSANRTFFAAFTKNKEKIEDSPQNVTAVYCNTTYYQQPVLATVDSVNRRPLHIQPLGEKQLLAPDIFNISSFEESLNAGSLGHEVRGDSLPASSVPRYLEPLARTNITLTGGDIRMVGLSFGASNRPLEEYLDWQILSKSYADAYRLIFARAMVDVLGNDFQSAEAIIGERKITTEAIVLEPVFVYIVEALLGVVSLATIGLLYLSTTRPKNLRSNPGTIASVMSLVADSQPLLSDFQDLDCCTMDEMKAILGQKRYRLVNDGTHTGIVEVDTATSDLEDLQSPMLSHSRRETPSNIAKPIRPLEFSLWTASPLVCLFIALAICLALIFVKAEMQGLPLPSNNSFVQNILENYIPTAIATLIEPIWILLNRLLCMLQPIEELQTCNARAKKSIDLDYSSLPPQLVIIKAMRSKHFILAAVCSMALLANLLAVAFAGLFHQDTFNIRHVTTLSSPFDLKFVPINGSIGPDPRSAAIDSLESSGAYKGGQGEDQFLISESNHTRGTPLPAWTDDRLFYLPFIPQDNKSTNVSSFEATTRAFGAELDCTQLELSSSFQAGLEKDLRISTINPSINITVTTKSSQFQCTSPRDMQLRRGKVGEGCVSGRSSTELVLPLVPRRANATREEVEACMESIVLGWLRNPSKDCSKVQSQPLTKENSTFIQCKPRWLSGSAKIRVDPTGRLQATAQNLDLKQIAADDFPQYFTNDQVNLIGQSNLYLLQGTWPAWHNNSFTDEFMNYFIRRVTNSSRLADPNQSVPTFDMINEPLNKAYSGLFAIWLAANKDNLLVANEPQKRSREDGWRVEPETRLFVSAPMFAISEGILCTYIIVAILLYIRRPGQYLPRMPTSIASVIALFAASTAVQDMRNTSHLDMKGRAKFLEDLDARYGYGSFIGGGDGRVHIGIERIPFVRAKPKAAWWEKKVSSFRNGSMGS
ncbi:Nn.00g082010.m01.CDS01 [Neocucurbitaria sp. VM-36]